MKNLHSTRAQINNELAVRNANERAKKTIEAHMPEDEKANLKIDFQCECSDPVCQARVSLSLEEFEQHHNQNSLFVIAKGHNSPAVEKVIKTKRDMQIVEKYAL